MLTFRVLVKLELEKEITLHPPSHRSWKGQRCVTDFSGSACALDGSVGGAGGCSVCQHSA